MKEYQQGLLILTIICSLVSLLFSCAVLLLCSVSGMWKKGSVRIVMYILLTSFVSSLVLIMPTYKYSFFCTFQSYALHFTLISQVAWGANLTHLVYQKVVNEKALNKLTEIIYLIIGLVPAVLLSVPPIFSHTENNCWSEAHSPLQEIVSTFSYLIPFSVGFLAVFSFILGTYTHLDMFPKETYKESYEHKVRKISKIIKYTIVVYGIGILLFICGSLYLVSIDLKSFDYISMFMFASYGLIASLLFLNADSNKKDISLYFKRRSKKVNILHHDKKNPVF